METLKDAGVSAIAEDRSEEMIRIEIEREGAVELIALEVQDREDFLHHVRKQLELDAEILIFERDGDEPLTLHKKGRKALRLVAHRHGQIAVKVRYEHQDGGKNLLARQDRLQSPPVGGGKAGVQPRPHIGGQSQPDPAWG